MLDLPPRRCPECGLWFRPRFQRHRYFPALCQRRALGHRSYQRNRKRIRRRQRLARGWEPERRLSGWGQERAILWVIRWLLKGTGMPRPWTGSRPAQERGEWRDDDSWRLTSHHLREWGPFRVGGWVEFRSGDPAREWKPGVIEDIWTSGSMVHRGKRSKARVTFRIRTGERVHITRDAARCRVPQEVQA
jgi:hypothetical protein